MTSLLMTILLATGITMAERKTALVAFINASDETRLTTIENALKPSPVNYVPPVADPIPPTTRTLIWQTDNEGGMAGWNFGRQAIYDSGNGKTELSQLFSRSNSHAIRQSITGDGNSGARCFITGDKNNQALPHEMIATSYLYLPANFPWKNLGSSGANWFNLQQLKERQTVGASSFVNPTIYISITSDAIGPYIYIYNWILSEKKWYKQVGAITYLPLEKWIKLEWYTLSKVSGGATWLKQDDKLILDVNGIRTITSDSYVLNWSVNCYGGASCGSPVLYWDDCKLETPK